MMSGSMRSGRTRFYIAWCDAWSLFKLQSRKEDVRKKLWSKHWNRPQTKNEIPAGLAPAHGLTLVEVTY